MKRQVKIIWILILIFALLAALMFMHTKSFGKKEGRPMGRRQIEKIMVKVTPVKKEDLDFILSYVGSLKAKDEINVYSKVTGKLAEYKVNEGEAVEKGQTIALVDRDETGLKFELAKVESPISGVVGRTLLDKGANIVTTVGLAQGTPLAVIVNMEEMLVKLNIPESDIPYFKKGLMAQVQLDAYPNETFQGEVSKVSEIVDPQTRTLPIEITIPNVDHRLKSGMFCRIKIVASQHKEALVLPQDALVQEWGANYVFVVEDHTAKKKKVTLGIRENNQVEILAGLKEGEKVIVFGQQGLKDGTEVEMVQE